MITRIASIAGTVLCLFVATAESAQLRIEANSAYRTGQGGEFTIVPLAGDSVLPGIRDAYNPAARFKDASGNLGGFETFCIEFNETISPPTNYYYGISSEARAGGAGGPSPDPISIGTAWLYWQFSNGVLEGRSASNAVVPYDYDYSPLGGRSASAGLLQNAIWWLEGEITTDPGNTNPFLNKARDLFGSTVTNDNLNMFPVGVLNLSDLPDGSGRHQDQLVRLAVGVPEGGATVVLMGLALTGIGFVRRKLV
jgi:hypothetical protein